MKDIEEIIEAWRAGRLIYGDALKAIQALVANELKILKIRAKELKKQGFEK